MTLYLQVLLESASLIELFTVLTCCLLDLHLYPEDGCSTFSETSVNSYQTTVHNILERRILHLKFYFGDVILACHSKDRRWDCEWLGTKFATVTIGHYHSMPGPLSYSSPVFGYTGFSVCLESSSHPSPSGLKYSICCGIQSVIVLTSFLISLVMYPSITTFVFNNWCLLKYYYATCFCRFDHFRAFL
jgi:hypothetical protein